MRRLGLILSNTTAFLYSGSLYFLWHGTKWVIRGWIVKRKGGGTGCKSEAIANFQRKCIACSFFLLCKIP